MNVNQVKACSFVKITMTNRTGEKVKINVIIHKLNNNASSIILTASPTIKLKKITPNTPNRLIFFCCV